MSEKQDHILLVDDDQVTASLLKKHCESAGYKVDFISDPKEVFEVLDIKKHSIVLLDIVMPDISGLLILEKIREKYSRYDLPVIMITSKDRNSDLTHAFNLGANDYIVKPVHKTVALARIETHLSVRNYHKEEILKQQFEAIQSMIVTYNHEINNPLAIALGNLDLLQRKNDFKYIEKIEAALMRIAKIVKDIESFKKEQTQKVEYVEDVKMYKV